MANKSTPTVISISAKCSDLFTASVQDQNGLTIGEYGGYVPDFFPGEHYGDYVILDIELATGKIVNWRKPSKAEIEKLLTNE